MTPLAVADPTASFGPGLGGLLVTGLVLLALFGAAWLLRRGTLSLGPAGRKRSLGFNIETAFSLGERRSLAVVSVEGRRLLLGLTPTNISLIGELPRSEGNFGAALDRQTSQGSQT
jgi:flagellar protein FliO/FliZ